jgi:signal peptidase I
MKTARTFIAGLLLPGLGFVVADRLCLGVAAAGIFFATILLFSLSRLVLVPAGYYAMSAIAITVVAWSVIHPTWIAYSSNEAAAPKVRWAVVAVFAAIVTVAVWGTILSRATNLGYETFRLPSNSMSPTLVAGDYILVDTWHFSEVDPQFGDMVVFDTSANPGTKYAKRIIGVPGDSIELRNNILYLNAKLMEESYVLLTGDSPLRYRNHEQVTIAPDEYFVLGDNRDNSRDSRFFGPVPRENIKGRVAHLWYSPTREFPLSFAIGGT